MQETTKQLLVQREELFAEQSKLTRELIELDIEIAKRMKYNNWPAARRLERVQK